MKWVCDLAKRKSFLSSFLVMFRLGLWLKTRLIAVSMVSCSGILVKRLVSYIVGNNKFFGKICIPNLKNKRESILVTVIIRNQRWKKITKEAGKIIIKSTYRWNNRKKFRKWITGREVVHFRSTIDTSRSRTRKVQFIIFNFI